MWMLEFSKNIYFEQDLVSFIPLTLNSLVEYALYSERKHFLLQTIYQTIWNKINCSIVTCMFRRFLDGLFQDDTTKRWTEMKDVSFSEDKFGQSIHATYYFIFVSVKITISLMKAQMIWASTASVIGHWLVLNSWSNKNQQNNIIPLEMIMNTPSWRHMWW